MQCKLNINENRRKIQVNLGPLSNSAAVWLMIPSNLVISLQLPLIIRQFFSRILNSKVYLGVHVEDYAAQAKSTHER